MMYKAQRTPVAMSRLFAQDLYFARRLVCCFRSLLLDIAGGCCSVFSSWWPLSDCIANLPALDLHETEYSDRVQRPETIRNTAHPRSKHSPLYARRSSLATAALCIVDRTHDTSPSSVCQQRLSFTHAKSSGSRSASNG